MSKIINNNTELTDFGILLNLQDSKYIDESVYFMFSY